MNASSFVFEATGLFHLHTEVLHVGEDHVLHRLAESSREKKSFLQTFHAWKGGKDDLYFTTSPLLWVVMLTCNTPLWLTRSYVK